ncbi:MAG: alpha-ketoacid dehydrogenase subunit beta, partial [Candidatus Nanohaloarchaea archaeon]|nr:alpha-ketoacid dehydrogenase subunit beta [Candidatus Nanohaloarchaea archaeon]
MSEMNLVEAVRSAMDTEMERDDKVLVMGEDVGVDGGVFRATEGLLEKYGDDRVIDTPLSESGIVGTALGLAVRGFRPVAEIQFMG